jgi:predicted RNA-binding protein YlxR (DUF448 family)
MSGRRQRQAPQRQCILCRDHGEQRELTRIVRLSPGKNEGGVALDPSTGSGQAAGKSPGRGAYVCQGCRRADTKRADLQRKIEQALGVRLSDDELRGLEAALLAF